MIDDVIRKYGAAKRCFHPTSQRKAVSLWRRLETMLDAGDLRELGTASAHVRIEGPGELDDVVRKLAVKYKGKA